MGKEIKLQDIRSKEAFFTCEAIANYYVTEFSLSEPIQLNIIAEDRNAELLLNEKLPVFGNLKVSDNGFKISIKTRIDNDHPYYSRFIVAHELAHTFFYTSINGKPIDNSNTIAGDKKLEQMCNYLAGCLLCPKTLLERYAISTPNPESYNFSYSTILRSIRKFCVTEKVFLTRMVQDLMLWDFPIFKLIKVPYIDKNEQKRFDWKLKDHFIPKRYSDRSFFIPRGTFSVNEKDVDYSKLPTVKGNLNKLLENLYTNLPDKFIYWFDSSLKMILAPPIDNFVQAYKDDFLELKIGAFKTYIGKTPIIYLFFKQSV